MFHLAKWLRRSSRRRSRASRRAADARRPLSLVLERLEDRLTPAPTILSNYAGLNESQTGGWVPPDSNGAAGPSSYVETANLEVALFPNKINAVGEKMDSFDHFLFTVGGLSQTDGGSFRSDPITVYDEQIGRFIVGVQDVDFSTHVGNFDIAVSKTSSPATLTAADWNFYQISTTESGYDADYPGNFGYNHDAFVYTLNMFGASNHVLVTSVNAADLAAGVSQANLHTYQNDLADFSVRPTVMHDSIAGDPMWLVSQVGDGSHIRVYKMTNVLSTSAGFAPTTLTVHSYTDVANVPPQDPGGVITYNTDSRIMKAAEENNTLVATQGVSVSATEDDARWYIIDVSSGTPVLKDQGDVSFGNNTYAVYPGIDINAGGDIGMSIAVSGTGAGQFMSMYVTGRAPSDAAGTMEAPVLVPSGTGTSDNFDGRQGDMSGINVDPVDGSFWAVNEFSTNNTWNQAIADFTLGGDLQLSMSGPATVTAGTNVTYTVTLTLTGGGNIQNVSLTDDIPAGTTFVSVAPVAGKNPDGFTYLQFAGTVTGIPVGGIVAGGHQDVFRLVVHANSSNALGSSISDTANVSTTSPDDNEADNDETATVTSTVTTVSDLKMSMSGPALAPVGTNATFTVTLTNNGPSDAGSVSLTDAVPAGTTFVSAAPVAGKNPDGFSYSQAGGVVTGAPTGGSVAAGNQDQFVVVVQINLADADGSTVSDTATVTTSAADDNNTDNDETATVSTTVVGIADLKVNMSGPATVTAGTDVTYTITLTNAGPSNARAVSLTDAVPTGTTFVSASPVAGQNPDGFTYSQSAGVVTGAPTGFVFAGNQDEFTLVVHVGSSNGGGSSVVNTANVTSSTADDNEADNDETATITSTVAAVADLQVNLSGPATVTAGTNITYTVTLTNNGPSDAASVSLTDAVPAGTTFVSAAPVAGKNPDGFSYSQSAGVVTGAPTGGVVAAGSQDEFTLVVQASSSDSSGSTVSNTANITATTTDDNEADNDETATVNSAVVTVADLQVSMSGPAAATAGTDITYTVTLTNNGPSDAASVSLTDAVPTGTTFVSAAAVSGQNPDGFSYSLAGGTVTGAPTGGVVAAGNQDQFVLVVHAGSGDADGSHISNTANVTTTAADDNEAINDETATVTSNVVAVADLVVSQANSANSTEGQNLTLTVTIVNNGPSDAQNVSLTDAVPSGTTFVSSSFSGYSAGNNTVSLGAIPSGSSVSGSITVHAAEEGNVSNTATITSTTTDDNPADHDDRSTASTSVADPDITAAGGFVISAVEGTATGPIHVAEFIDPAGGGDTEYTATIAFGDGPPYTGLTLFNGGIVDLGPVSGGEEFAVVASHTYISSGVLSATVLVQHGSLAPFVIHGTADVSGDVVINGTGGNDALTLTRTAGGGVGSVTYVLNGGAPVALTGVNSFTFNGSGGDDSMTVNFSNGEPLVPAGVFFDGGSGSNTLNVNAAGLPVKVVPGSFTVGDPQTVGYVNAQTTNIDNAGGVNALAGQDTADRATAFVGLSARERFVQTMYLDALGRAGAVSELDGWAGLFNSPGRSQEQDQAAIVAGIEATPEARDRLVSSWYVSYLGRQAQGGEELGWVNLLVQGKSEEQVLSLILSTSEFYNRAQTLVQTGSANERYVQALYQGLLNRTGDPDSIAAWAGVVPVLGARQIVSDLLASSEFRTDQFEAIYNALLHRPDDGPGVASWVFSNLDMRAVRLDIEASDEFFVNG